jgi:hypothetical protein
VVKCMNARVTSEQAQGACLPHAVSTLHVHHNAAVGAAASTTSCSEIMTKTRQWRWPKLPVHHVVQITLLMQMLSFDSEAQVTNNAEWMSDKP